MKHRLAGILLLVPILLGAQPQVEKLDSDDISSAIKMLGLEIFKYDFSKQDLQYSLVIHVDEIVNTTIVKNKSYKLGSWTAEQEKKIKIISKVTSDTASTYWLKISHPNMETQERFNIPKEFIKIHFWKQITSGEIEYNKKTPLLFYGTGWEAVLNGRKVLRFCWGEEVSRDMSNPTLKKIEHMILISYELVKQI
jgi:hypothetical protein